MNVKKTGVQKPATEYIAKVNTTGEINIYGSKSTSDVLAKAKNGTVIDIIQNDTGSGFTKIWFNSKECYIETKNLTDIQSSPTAASIASLGNPIGVIVTDSAWSAYGETVYSPDGFEIYKKYLLGEYTDGSTLINDMSKLENSASEMKENYWANVYKIENITYAPDPDFPEETEKATIYTLVYDGNIRYLFKSEYQAGAFTYYPGNSYGKTTVSKTQPLYVDTVKYNALAYNINGNNYFKLRDIAKMLDGTTKSFDVTYDGATNSIDMLSYFNYTSVGGDGTTKKAVASSAFLTYDGVPIKTTCYNIDGNNYFNLRDVTDALDCRVEWDSDNKLIKIITTVPAYQDINEPVG